MRQKFSLEAAGKLLGVSASAVRARARKSPETYPIERDNRGKIWLLLDPENLPSLKPSTANISGSTQPALKPAMQVEIDGLRDQLAEARQRASVAEALADERARALLVAERNLADVLRLVSPPAPALKARRRWWPFG